MQYIEELLIAAQNRKTSQGVMIYQWALEQLRSAESDSAVMDVLLSLKAALLGIDAHGFFPANEYRIVEKIQALAARVGLGELANPDVEREK